MATSKKRSKKSPKKPSTLAERAYAAGQRRGRQWVTLVHKEEPELGRAALINEADSQELESQMNDETPIDKYAGNRTAFAAYKRGLKAGFAERADAIFKRRATANGRRRKPARRRVSRSR